MKRIAFFVLAFLLLFNTSLFLFSTARADPSLPGPPRNLTFYNLTSTSVRLKWSPPEDGSVSGYRVYKNGQYLFSPVFTVYDVTGLEPGTAYTFKVNAYNEAGEGPFSNEIILTTETEDGRDGNATGSITYPSGGQRLRVLERVEGTALDDDGTVISAAVWIIDSQGRYLTPDLSAFESAADPMDYLIPVHNTGINYSTWELDLSGCPALTDGVYTIVLCVNDSYWNTGAVQPVSITLDSTPPEPPFGLNAEEITASSITLGWQPPSSQDVEIYNLYINGSYYASTEQNRIHVSGLTPNTCYSFRVTSSDGLNESQPSSTLEVSTLPANPGNASGTVEFPPDGSRLPVLDKIYGRADDDEGIWGAWLQVNRQGDGYYLSEDISAFVERPCSIQVLGKTNTLSEEWELTIPGNTPLPEDAYTVTLSVYDGEMNHRADRITFTIDETPPGAPENVSISFADKDNIQIDWDPVEDADVESYYIYVNGQLEGTTADTQYILGSSGLERAKEYLVTVRSWDGLYFSEHSQPVKVIIPPERQDVTTERKSKSPGKPVWKYSYCLEDGTLKVKVKARHEWLEDALRQQQGDSLTIDATNYFPGKQISQEVFWLEEDLLQGLKEAGKDLIISGKLGRIGIKTSLASASTAGGHLEITLKREESSPLGQFINSHKGFRLLSDTLSVNFNSSLPAALTLDISTEVKGDVGRIGIIRISGREPPVCQYDMAKIDLPYVEFSVTVPGTYACIAYKNPYPDIKGHWAEEEIDLILSQGIYVADGPGLLPNNPVTVQELTSLVHRGLGIELDEKFARSSKETEYFARKELAEIAVELYSRLAGTRAGGDNNTSLDGEVFRDLDFVEPYYRGCIQRAQDLGLMKGLGYGCFGPEQYVTRAQAIVVLWRLMNMKEVEIKKTLKNQVE